MSETKFIRFGPGTCKYCGYPAPEGCYLCETCAKEEAAADSRERQEDDDDE